MLITTRLKIFLVCAMMSFIIAPQILAQRTVGLLQYSKNNTDGYVLFAPLGSMTTYLVDKCGKKVHSWTSDYLPGLSSPLLKDGTLLRAGKVTTSRFNAGGNGGIIERFDWEGNRTWNYRIASDSECTHHDFKVLPNGNILMIAWEAKNPDQQVLMGRWTPLLVDTGWSEKIIELRPIGTDSAEIVWQWKLWDHTVQDFDASRGNYGTISEHPELININYGTHLGGNDWVHMNSVDYNADLDQIVMSSYGFDELWVIDHSTSTAQAASHSGGNSGKGGDILYRWGNPATYNRGILADKRFFRQHDVHWIPRGMRNEGKLICFNNGEGRFGGIDYSTIDIIDPPIDSNNSYSISGSNAFGPSEVFWQYSSPVLTDLYSGNLSGVQSLSNGSLLICLGAKGAFWEIDSTSSLVWKYTNPVSTTGALKQGTTPIGNSVFRAELYAPNYAGFANHLIDPSGEIELDPISPPLCEPQPIETGSIRGWYCAGSSIVINAGQNTTFDPKNVFYIQLSDTSGSFAKPRVIDSLAGIKLTEIIATLPVDLLGGTKYRIRVVATLPQTIGADNGSNITVIAAPKVTFDPPSPYKVCHFVSPVNITASGGTVYEWRDGSTSATRSVSKPGWYYVTTKNLITSCSRTDSIQVIDAPFLDTKIVPAKAPILCQGETVKLTAMGGRYFRWSTGDTTKNITVSKQGWYKIAATENGCSGADSIFVTVKPLPQISMTPAGSRAICPGSNLTLTASTAKNYKWSTGDTTKTITVWTTGTYYVTTKDSNSCSNSSEILNVSMLPAPAKPIIIQNGKTLSTTSDLPLQWYFNAKIIPGATGQSITANEDGMYMVMTIASNTCTATSDVFTYTETHSAVDEKPIAVGVSISPNPFKDKCTITVANETRSSCLIECYNILGEKIATIFSGDLEAGKNQVQYLPPPKDHSGSYFIRIQSGNDVKTFKVIAE